MALNSVHTNTGAIIALQGLNRTNLELEQAQKRVNTGYRISDALDDGAGFAIAQTLRGQLNGYESIGEQLSKAKGTMSVANAVATEISNTLIETQSVLTKLADENVTGTQRTQYENDYAALKTEITNFINNAAFNGTNILNAAGTLNVIGALDGSSISVTTFDLATDISAELTAAVDADGTLARALLGAGGGFANAMSNIGDTLAQIGADIRTLDNQINYVNVLRDATETGIGDIVDADLAKESAKLQALQIRQQLGTQTLSIANGAPSILLNLFQ